MGCGTGEELFHNYLGGMMLADDIKGARQNRKGDKVMARDCKKCKYFQCMHPKYNDCFACQLDPYCSWIEYEEKKKSARITKKRRTAEAKKTTSCLAWFFGYRRKDTTNIGKWRTPVNRGSGEVPAPSRRVPCVPLPCVPLRYGSTAGSRSRRFAPRLPSA